MDKPSPSYNVVERAAVRAEIEDLEKQINTLDTRTSELSAKVRTMRDDWQMAPADQWHDTRWIRLAVEVLAGITYQQQERIFRAAGYSWSGGIDGTRKDLQHILQGMIALREQEEKTAK